MTEVPPEIKAVDVKLAESESAYRTHLLQRAKLLEDKLAAFDSLLRERNKIAMERQQIVELLSLYSEGEQPAKPGASSHGTSYGASSVVPGEFADTKAWPVWKACAEVLRREGREMFTGELVTRLKAGGRELNDKTQSSQVNSSIRGMTDVFYTVKRKGKATWGLVEWRENDEEAGS